MILPIEFEQRMISLLGEEYAEFREALEREPVKGFRVNTEKIDLSQFEKINPFGKEKIPYVENGFYLDFEKVGNHPYHHAGLIYVQEPAAMAPAECIEINPNWKILDMCAAPGGKSTQLKNKLGENGVLVSNEIVSSRLKILAGNIERLGLKNTVTTSVDTERLAKAFPQTFDLVMVDAPCSGEGMFRKEEAAVSEWSLENVKKCAVRQTEILENAAKAVKDGGYIIYATCTFSLEENEMQIDGFLKRHSDFTLVPVTQRVAEHTADGIAFGGCECANIHLARRCYPHKLKGEGQFMAVLRKNEEGRGEFYSTPQRKKNITPDKALTDFLDDVLQYYNPDAIKLYNKNYVFYEGELEIPEKLSFSCGVTIGELRKNYIQPHHQFFMALGKDFKRKIDLEPQSEEIKKYLHGEEIEVDCPNGWAVITVNGCAAGGVKVVNGVAKNHYPKGLRIK